MVGYSTLFKVIGTDLFRASTALDLVTFLSRLTRCLLVLSELQEASSQHTQRFGLVLQLTLFVLHRNHKTGRQVRYPDC